MRTLSRFLHEVSGYAILRSGVNDDQSRDVSGWVGWNRISLPGKRGDISNILFLAGNGSSEMKLSANKMQIKNQQEVGCVRYRS